MKQLLGTIFFVLLAFSLSATHIVGGEINYRCLGGDLYEIKLTVYRDCFNGVPYFDNPACIGIFDVNNNLLDTLMTRVRNDDTLTIFLNDPCVIIPPDICYHTTTYVDTAFLPFRPGGYQIVYQRCCRNWTINNLINPGNVGMTYYTFIGEEALLGCNSNPVFTNWPPPLICNNVPIFFDHSAIDADGDLLVYELCAPLDGALVNDPMPQPPFAPPYNTVPWLAPYGPNNMLGGAPGLGINATTGLLTGTPNVIGQFVVGVCVNEYRNGQLISVTRRDFQYNVRDCSTQNQAAFFAPEVVCDSSLTVNFINQSQSIGNGFLWNFGDPTTPNDTSTLVAPSWVYPDTGTYTITLIAGPGSLCSDTFVSVVNVQYTSLNAGFTFDILSCGEDSLVVQFFDQSVDTTSTIVSWYWNFGNGEWSTDQNPVFTFDSAGAYGVFLGVGAANGCGDFVANLIPVALPGLSTPNDQYYLCPPALGGDSSVVLNFGGNPTLSYQWSPPDWLSDPFAASPVASPPVTTTYTVTVTAINDGNDTCTQTYMVTVNVLPPFEVYLPTDTLLCGNFLDLNVNSNNGGRFFWFADAQYTIPIDLENPLTLSLTGDTTLYLIAEDAGGCIAEDSMNVLVSSSPLLANFSYLPTACTDSIIVTFTDLSVDSSGVGVNLWTWDWGDGTQVQDTVGLVSYVHDFDTSGIYVVTLAVYNPNGCNDAVQVPIEILIPEIQFFGDSLRVCLGDSVALVQSYNPAFTYSWTPVAGLSDPNAPAPMASPAADIQYFVEVSTVVGDTFCSDVFVVGVAVPLPPAISTGPDIQTCPGQLTVDANIPDGVVLTWSNEPDFDPVIYNVSGDSTFTFVASQDTTWYVLGEDVFGCGDRDTLNVVVLESAIAALPTTAICLGDSATIFAQNLVNTPVVNWVWSPDGNILSGQGTNTIVVSPSEDGFYRIIGQNALGCADTAYVSLDVFETPPIALATATPNQPYFGQTVQLETPEGQGYTYVWAPTAGLNLPNTFNPTVIPTVDGFYSVTVTDANGCSASSTVQVLLRELICDEPFIFVPNAFSPNGDGENDLLFVRSNILSEVYFAVYDRWGELVFETTDLNTGWDGTFRGKELAPDAFGWYLRAKCINNQPFDRKGNVTILR